MSYDVFIGGVDLHVLGVSIDFWGKIAYYHLGWQIRISHKASLPMTFIGG